MEYASKVVLKCPNGYRMGLDALVERFLTAGVRFEVEDIIDELVVGDGSDPSRFILTSSHPGESVADVLDFARSISGVGDDEPQVVVLAA